MKFTVEVFGDRALDMLRDIAQRSESRTVMEMMGEVLTDYEHALFATGNRGKWRRLNPETIQQKHNARILIDKGHLMRDLTNRAQVQRDSVGVFSKQPYAMAVKKGRPPRKDHRGAFVGKKVPGRNPAPRPPKPVLDQWERILLHYVAEGR